MPDHALGDFFKKAEKDLNEVAKKHGFTVRLVDATNGTWYFFPEVEEDFIIPKEDIDAERNTDK